MARADADDRGFRLLDARRGAGGQPGAPGRGAGRAALHDRRRGRAPRCALPALRGWLEPATATPAAATRSTAGAPRPRSGPGYVVDHTGERHRGDVVVVCPGAERQGPMAELLDGAPGAPGAAADDADRAAGRAPHHVDGRRRLAALLPRLRRARPGRPAAPGAGGGRAPHAAAHLPARRRRAHRRRHPRLRRAVRLRHHRGARTHHLQERAESILGRPLPPVVRRWTGVYSQCLDESICHRRQVAARACGWSPDREAGA